MAENTSGAQHLTELDFDISAIPAQFKQIEQMIEKKGKDIQTIIDKNWKIKDIIKIGEGGTGEFDKAFQAAADQMRKLIEEKSKLMKSDNLQSKYAEDAYKVNEKAYSLSRQINDKNSGATEEERQKLKLLKDQTDELIKQLKTKQQFSVKDLEQIGNIKEQLRVMENQANTCAEIINDKPIQDGESYLEKAKGFLQQRSFEYAEIAVKKGFSTIKEVESQMLDLKRIIDLGTMSIDSLKTSMFGLGKEYGREFENVADITLKYAQAGYNANDALMMTKDSLLAVNTAELNIENSTNSLIGILQQWGLEAKDLSGIIDVLNYTADNNAITTQDLVDGLLNASSVAQVANMSFNDTVGVLTAMKEASGRSGEEVGNAFKSIVSYIQQASSLNIFDSMGIEVYADKATGKLLPMMNILENMSGKWKAMGKAQQDAFIANNVELYSEDVAVAIGAMEDFANAQYSLAQSTDMANSAEVRSQAAQDAGIYRRNYYIALMENFKNAVKISYDSLKAEGYSVQENAIYMETLDAKLKTLVTSLKEMAVQAGDAGLMDIAKAAVEAASAVIAFTKGTGGLMNALFALAGVMTIVKASKLSATFTDIGTTLKGAITGIKTFATSLKSADNTQKMVTGSATVMGTALQSALGIIGLVSVAISVVVGAVSAHNAEIEENNRLIAEKAQKAKEESDRVSELISQYEKLKATETQDESTRQQIQSIQDEITKLVGKQAENLDLVNGKLSEQMGKLKGVNIQVTENTLAMLKSDMLIKEQGAKKGYKQTWIEDNLITADFTGKLFDQLYDVIPIDSSRRERNNPVEYLQDLDVNDQMIKLKEWQELLNVKQNSSSDDYSKSIGWVSEVLSELAKAQDEATAAKKVYYEQDAKFRVDFDSQTTIIDSTESYKAYTDSIRTSTKYTLEQKQAMLDVASRIYSEYAPAMDEVTHAQEMLSNPNLDHWAREHYEGIISNATAQEGLTAVTIKYEDVIKDTNASLGDMLAVLNDVNITGEQKSQIQVKINSQLKTYQSEISSLAGHITTLNNGGSLTAEQMISLIELYPELSSRVQETADGFSIEVSALETLRASQVDSATAMKISQMGFSETVLAEVESRMSMYKNEIMAIKNLADAQAFLLKADSDIQHAQEMLSNPNIDHWAKEYYQDQIEQANDAKDVADDYITSVENIDKLMNQLGRSSSDTGKKASSAAEEVKQSLSDLTKEFDIMVSMGLLSTQEQVNYFEELLRTTELTTENIQSVQGKLHNLYLSQIKDQVEVAKQASQDRINGIEDEYAAKLEAVNDYYDSEINKIDEVSKALKKQRDEQDYQKEMSEGKYTLDNYELDYSQRKTLVDSMNKLTLDRQRKDEDDALELSKQRLQDEKAEKIKVVEEQKAAAIKAENEKQAEIERIFNEGNLNMIAAAGNYAPELYNKFLEFFTNPLKGDLEGLITLMAELAGKSEDIKGQSSGGKAPTGGAGGNKPPTTGNGNSGSLSVGDIVRVNGSLYSTAAGAGKGTTLKDYVGKITLNVPGAPMPYHIDGKGWVKSNSVVRAKTGGETLEDGLAFLHKNEFIANSEITNGLRAIIDPEMIKSLREIKETRQNIANYINNHNNNLNNNGGSNIVQNFNAPFHQVHEQNVNSETNARILANSVTNQIMTQLNNLPKM